MFPVAALAQEIEQGVGLICNTQAQVERHVAIVDGDVSAAVTGVNAEAQSTSACGLAPVAYVRVANLSTVSNKHGTFKVVGIVVIGIVTPAGLRPVPPLEQVTLFRVDDRGA